MRHLVELLHPARLASVPTVELDFGMRVRPNDDGAEAGGDDDGSDANVSGPYIERLFVVFDTAEVLATSADILSRNKIPSWCSPFLGQQSSEPEGEGTAKD